MRNDVVHYLSELVLINDVALSELSLPEDLPQSLAHSVHVATNQTQHLVKLCDFWQLALTVLALNEAFVVNLDVVKLHKPSASIVLKDD